MRPGRRGLSFVLVCVVAAGGPVLLAHTPTVDAQLVDWCVGARSNTAIGIPGRTEDSAVALTCGNCSVSTNRACEVDADCLPAGGVCVNTTSKTEIAWWDNRTDGGIL